MEIMFQVDEEAWERWKAYRVAIRKPIKAASEHAMRMKLSRYGADQAAVVEQSIANQYQGLFDLKDKRKPDRPTKTAEQKAADDAMFQAAQDRAAAGWQKAGNDAIARLKLCDALWARYTLYLDNAETAEKIEWLKGVIGMHLREANARQVLDDPHLTTMVFTLFGPRGLNRLRERAQ